MSNNKEKKQCIAKSPINLNKYRNPGNAPHRHYCCELIYVQSGAIDISCENTNYTVHKNNAVFINSQQVHSVRSLAPDTVCEFIAFDYSVIKPFAADITLCSPVLTQNYDIHTLYDEIKNELSKTDELRYFAAENKLSACMIAIFRYEICKNITPPPPQKDLKLY